MATEQSIVAVIRAARPSFRNRHDKVAFAVHAAFLSSGYVLNSTGASALRDDALASAPAFEVGIENWNEVEDHYAFVYSNPEEGSKRVIVKCLALNNQLAVDVLEEGSSEPLHLKINVDEFVEDKQTTDFGAQFKNLGKLASAINVKLLKKTDGTSGTSASSQSNLRDDRSRHFTGGLTEREDHPYGTSSLPGYIIPAVPDSGWSDLNPGPGAGMYPSRGGLGEGSMLVGPGDPRFFGGRSGDIGPGGLPTGVVPPGARFDPYGPPGVPGFEPNRFARNPRRPGGGGGTHPDLQHFHDGYDFI